MNLRKWSTTPDSAAMIKNNGQVDNSKQGDNDRYYIQSTATRTNWYDSLNIYGSLTGGIAAVLNSIFITINGIIFVIITLYSIPISQLFFVVGPLAFASSVLPWFREQYASWLGTYLGVIFVFTTLNIIQALEYMSLDRGVADFGVNWSASQDGNLLNELAFNIAQTCVYISAFWVTGKWIGTGDGGRPAQQALQVATQLAQIKLGTAKGGAFDWMRSMFPSGSSSAENAIQVAKESKTT